eukprot:scaffold4079_cov167-Amphora_coffeaeformis.AAC.4
MLAPVLGHTTTIGYLAGPNKVVNIFCSAFWLACERQNFVPRLYPVGVILLAAQPSTVVRHGTGRMRLRMASNQHAHGTHNRCHSCRVCTSRQR